MAASVVRGQPPRRSNEPPTRDPIPAARVRQDPDRTWLIAGRHRHRTTPRPTKETPEAAAQGYWACVRDGDSATALYFAMDAIELLHHSYVFSSMRRRMPGFDDYPLLRICATAFATVKAERPRLPLRPEASVVIALLDEIIDVGRCERISDTSLIVYQTLADELDQVDEHHEGTPPRAGTVTRFRGGPAPR